MKLTTNQVSTARFHRRSGKGSCYKKLLSSHPKSFNGSKREIIRVTSPCDNSDDSGLGIENSSDYLSNSVIPPSVFRFASSQKRSVDEPFALSNKRHRTDLKTHNDLEDSYSFPLPPLTLSNSNPICVSPPGLQNTIPMAAKGMRRSVVSGKRFIGPPTLSTQLSSTSRNNKVQLQILNQPEQQHRARYQTEGSRGAVKDRTGNSFPIVKITGYNKPTTLQVFIGSDQGRVTPHMFYQACRVTGKNSTPCSEKNINGTIVIEIDVDPTKDMLVTCDCVGILKERNVDVEHRFPEECSTRSKKKSTRCRMVFRAAITNDDGTTETLQVASQPIACTQPPGIPEICKKSLTSCPAGGGKELFILGKNFLKDTHVMFQTEDWEQSVNPDKEFLQQTHLVCTVPSFKNVEITEAVSAKICVISGNRTSEPHSFTYTPMKELLSSSANSPAAESSAHAANTEITTNSDVDAGLSISNETQIKTSSSAMDACETLRPVMLWQGSGLSSSSAVANNCNMLLQQNDSKMMPPPVMLPRRSSVPMIVPDGLAANVKADAGSVTSDEMTPLTNATAAAAAVVAAANQMATASNPYVSTPYNALPDVPIIQDFARNYHAINEVEHPVLKTEPVLKVEPLPEPSPSAAGIVEVSQQPSSVCRTTMKSVCTSQSTASMYLSPIGDENYLYKSAADLYPVSKTEPRSSPTEEMTSAFDVTSSAAPMMTANTLSSLMLPTGHPAHGYLSSGSMSDSNDMLVNMSSPSSNSSVSSASPASVVLDKQLPDKMSDMMATSLSDASYKRMLSPQSSPPQQLQQIQSPLSSCSLKQASYDGLRNPFCYQNVVPPPVVSEPNVTNVYHQNYLNLEPAGTQLAAANESVSSIMFKNQQTADVASAASNGASPTKPLSPLAMSMMENSLMSDIMRQPKSSPPATNFGAAVMPMAKTFVSPKSYLDSQSQDTLALSEYVPSALVSNPASTVPKLEELVNSAADSHIRSGTAAAAAAAAASSAVASMSLLGDASTVGSNAASGCSASSAQMALTSFLAEPQRQDVLGSVICNAPTTVASSCSVVASSCGMVGENSMLASRVSEPAAANVYQSCGGGSMVELSVAATAAGTAVGKQMSMLEMKMAKEEKSMSVNAVQAQQMAKKSAEGMFPSEISRMSERDLLNYINPSCFDEAQRPHI